MAKLADALKKAGLVKEDPKETPKKKFKYQLPKYRTFPTSHRKFPKPQQTDDKAKSKGNNKKT